MTGFDPIDLANYARRFGRVLAWIPPDDWSYGPAPWTISNALKAARTNGLVESRQRGASSRYYCQWRLTELGRAVLERFMLGETA